MGAITRGIANNILGSGAVDGTDALTGTIPATNIGNPSLANLTTFPPSVDAGIPQVAGDPPSPSEGDVWYNTNTYKLKVRGLGPGSWATSGNMNTARDSVGGIGTQTSALAFGGQPVPIMTSAESYNGATWTTVSSMSTARRDGFGAGADNTAALAVGGQTTPDAPTANVESWNGSSWTEVNNLNTGRRGGGTSGTQTSALISGGSQEGGAGIVANTETWNGTSWTETTDLNTARSPQRAAGSSSSDQLNAKPPDIAQWNGTSWTAVSDLNTSRNPLGMAGTSTSALGAGGPSSGLTEIWNGTSWSEDGDLNTGRSSLGAGGTTTAAVVFGGNNPSPVTAATEEFTGAGSPTTVTFTDS